MPLSDDELRDLVRESVARHLRTDPVQRNTGLGSEAARVAASIGHASHVLLPVAPGSGEADGLCLIEPSVHCNHCGYCQSYGH